MRIKRVFFSYRSEIVFFLLPHSCTTTIHIAEAFVLWWSSLQCARFSERFKNIFNALRDAMNNKRAVIK